MVCRLRRLQKHNKLLSWGIDPCSQTRDRHLFFSFRRRVADLRGAQRKDVSVWPCICMGAQTARAFFPFVYVCSYARGSRRGTWACRHTLRVESRSRCWGTRVIRARATKCKPFVRARPFRRTQLGVYVCPTCCETSIANMKIFKDIVTGKKCSAYWWVFSCIVLTGSPIFTPCRGWAFQRYLPDEIGRWPVLRGGRKGWFLHVFLETRGPPKIALKLYVFVAFSV